MKKINLLMILMICFVVSLVGCTGKKNIEDSNVKDAVLEDDVVQSEDRTEEVEDKNIIAGTLMSAELLDLFDINPVGVLTTEKNLPQIYNDITKIGSPMKPDLEIVASLEPELYITDVNLKESLEERFRGTDVEMMFLNNNSYEDVFINIENVGTYLNKADKAKEIILEMRKKEKEILNSISEKQSPKVLIIFGTPESFMIATPNSYSGSLVEKLGGINVASDLAEGKPMPYLPFSLETIADLNPEVILRLTHVSSEQSKKAFDEEFSKGFWSNIDAVKNGKVYDLDPNHFGVTANLGVMNALEELAKILYN